VPFNQPREKKLSMNNEVSFGKFSNSISHSKHISDLLCSFLAETLDKLVRRKPQHMKLCLSIRSQYSSLVSFTRELGQKL